MRTGWKILIGIVLMILFFLGVVAGVYFYEENKIKDSDKQINQLASFEQNQIENQIENEVVSTSISETKLSPNCTITEKQYFNGCDHLVKEIKDIPKEWINFTEEQVEEMYADWEVESVTNNQIIVSQEKEGFCGQHYVVRENGEVLGVYMIDESGKETWKEDTEIAVRYLTDEDLERVQEGIKVIGDDQLHSVLEDFE